MINHMHTAHHAALREYYGWHAAFYDVSRWAFLFGRNRLIQTIPALPENASILEVGCGTGHNLENLRARFPAAEITGLDLSPAMLQNASKKDDHSIQLVNESYEKYRCNHANFDLIVLSYSLTMMHRSPQKIMRNLHHDLSRNGLIAVVDFHHTPFSWFQWWMQKNHAAIDGSYVPLLKRYFRPVEHRKRKAYGGLWTYFNFIGQKKKGTQI